LTLPKNQQNIIRKCEKGNQVILVMGHIFTAEKAWCASLRDCSFACDAVLNNSNREISGGVCDVHLKMRIRLYEKPTQQFGTY